ncbi:hypothetical protein [Cylindrospermopsis curvispora]|uniref:Uncharacterized protein n=1 Tax=Cylindrospermopsis curvispora GIHE-G1 TaxID=2666332 RepID=A0A7H0F5V4_9CYAN|nr:hypothetical protein [Cylindrospermopsis curvispora]QNP31420.1 hypothetical protein IAR63_17680 [Cylindrospermopsis curvispora GIHE-G1]
MKTAVTILPKCHARLEAQVITYAIARRECFAIAPPYVQKFPLRRNTGNPECEIP